MSRSLEPSQVEATASSQAKWYPRWQFNLSLILVRLVYVVMIIGIAISIGQKMTDETWWGGNSALGAYVSPTRVMAIVIAVGMIVIAVDIVSVKRPIETISAIYFGLLVGMLMTYALTAALNPLLQTSNYRNEITLCLGTVLSYLCISRILQTKDDFRFVIPYVEFSRDLKGARPLLLDTSSIIDGRLAELAETSIIDGQLIMPRFVLSELQAIADSTDKMRRVRGRRGLDILNRLRNHEKIDFQLYERDLPELVGHPVDMKLVLLAKQLEAKVVTSDFNLNKVAKLHNVQVINLNEIANALRPQFLPGERFQLRVVKIGEGPDQGVGYLDDGTMVVIEGGRGLIGQTVWVIVTGTLQTNAGRMIFTRVDETSKGDSHS